MIKGVFHMANGERIVTNETTESYEKLNEMLNECREAKRLTVTDENGRSTRMRVDNIAFMQKEGR